MMHNDKLFPLRALWNPYDRNPDSRSRATLTSVCMFLPMLTCTRRMHTYVLTQADNDIQRSELEFPGSPKLLSSQLGMRQHSGCPGQ